MFTQKRKAEVVGTKVTKSKVNAFLANGKAETSKTRSGNGALKYSTSGNDMVDQFALAGSYKAPRTFDTIAKDCELLWAEDPLKAVKFILFLRTIPRTVNLPDGSKTGSPQKGTELKHEAIMRMLWLHAKQPEAFWNNILLFVSLGSWKDIFTMLEYDLSYNGWDGRTLNWDEFGDMLLASLNNKNTTDLVKKYLPQIKARSACKTIEAQSKTAIAKWVCSLIFGKKENAYTYKQYRKLKTSGTAHEWQKLISQGRFKDIDFKSIHGRALSLLVRGKFLKNHGLSDKYEKWITAPETKDVKYTGFVHELFQGRWQGDSNKEMTIDKQFDTLVQKARDNNVTELIIARDISGSMGSQCTGTSMTCYDVAKAMALYFSEFLHGTFANSYIEFESTAKMKTWQGSTPVAKWKNDKSSYVGGTNFQSVIDLLVKVKNTGVEESEFPKGILCISDQEFNPTSLNSTNVEEALSKLRRAGFSRDYVDNFVIILWNLQSRYYGKGTGEKFETGKDTKNVFYFGGFSPSVVSFLSEEIKTTYDLMEAALNQEILSMVEV